MSRRIQSALAFSAALGLAYGCSAPPKPVAPPLAKIHRDYQEPPYVHSVDGVVHFALAAIDNDERVPVFDYEGFYLAPTIEVNPGDQIQIAYHNLLAPRGVYLASGHVDETNLHFHGLTSSPEPPQDDAVDTLRPRYSTEYDLDVNPGQPPGLYWYHPHPHHESAWQVGSGMSGAIIVGGIQNEVPELAGLRERLLIVRQAFSEDERAERVAAGRNFCGLKRLTPAQRAAFLAKAGLKPRARADETALSVNGLPAGSVKVGIAPGEREFFRIVNGTGSRNLDLSIGSEELVLVAQDGVPLIDYPGGPRTERVRHILIPPAGRAEFIVTGPAVPTSMRTAAYDTGPQGDKNPAADLVSLVNDAGGTKADRRLPVARPAKPARSFYRIPLPAPSVERVVRFEEKADGTDFRINGLSFAMDAPPMFTARVGTVERWTLLNTSDEVHDFHIHQVHFTVESIDGVPVPQAQRRWLDEVNVPYRHRQRDGSTTPGKVVVLVDLRDPVIRGTFLFHCHILDHEDGGMMAKIRVI